MHISRATDGLFKNAILAGLDESSWSRLRLTTLPAVKSLRRLYRPGQPIEQVFFIETGFASITVPLADGTSVSAAILGSRSLVGAEALLGTGASDGWHEAITQWAGDIYSSTLEDARREFYTNEIFRHLVMEDLRIQLLQRTQMSACNGRHEVEQRLCRWLLLCHDEMTRPDIFVTHEGLAKAIGICRSTATTALDLLRRDGLIDCGRAHISIVNRPALDARACECYAIMRSMENGSSLRDGRLPEKRPSAGDHLALKPARPVHSQDMRRQVAVQPNHHVQ